MTITIAHLGPIGTYTETATIGYQDWLHQQTGQTYHLRPYPNILQTLQAVIQQEAKLAVVPVENSIQGSVAITLDTLWELDCLKIEQGLILPITHTLLSHSPQLENLKKIYSHPQALGQCQRWLDKHLPQVELIATNSTTEALAHLAQETTAGAIASQRAAELYNTPILATNINDYPDNCTRFWVVGLEPKPQGSYISLAFSVPKNIPGSLVKPLSSLAKRQINMSRIESRPTKRSLGEYLFFIDLEGSATDSAVQEALVELHDCTSVLKIFGSYNVLFLLHDTEGSRHTET
ncbi:prephenate dehydratase [Gloeocapsa sp. PCC 73106]|uniref:prephenate dehydratase n=1 Tax=Gloeocapsa sp. PCC 73106 TaxID=102232 RepID=UPI0002ABD64C|nr:prephenate dehydratase [Gloeocapsa sp. PCC 73106]ELR98328.1 prephenate dehydratase [Gloeocapsa sp. PCC 73106]